MWLYKMKQNIPQGTSLPGEELRMTINPTQTDAHTYQRINDQ